MHQFDLLFPTECSRWVIADRGAWIHFDPNSIGTFLSANHIAFAVSYSTSDRNSLPSPASFCSSQRRASSAFGSIARTTRRRVGIFHPDGGNDGSVQLLEMQELGGYDYASRCVAPNLGILGMIRFDGECSNAAAIKHMKNAAS